MRLSRLLQATTMFFSAAALLAYAPTPAKAAPADEPFGSCIGAAGGNDCVAAMGHISASVVGTLSINEMRAISFGNFAVPTAGNSDGILYLDPTGVRTAPNAGTDQIVLLNGANGCNGGPCGGAGGETGSQSPGHYTVNAGKEGGAQQVYISFAQSDGTPIDACSPAGSAGGIFGGAYGQPAAAYTGLPGTCDNYHPGSSVLMTGPSPGAFTVDQFVFNESGSDVYGHYIDETAAVGPGIGNPFLPGSASGSGHDNGTGSPGGVGSAQAIDVVVGATLHTTGVSPVLPGKYTGQFVIMVSY